MRPTLTSFACSSRPHWLASACSVQAPNRCPPRAAYLTKPKYSPKTAQTHKIRHPLPLKTPKIHPPLAVGLPRVDVLHDVPEADRTCPCGTAMVLIGQEISEQLDIVPMQVRVIRNIRNRYGCPGSQHAPVTATLPPQPLP